MSGNYSDPKLTKLAVEHYETYFALGGNDPGLKQVYETMKSFIQSK
jgi:hypothetical protein